MSGLSRKASHANWIEKGGPSKNLPGLRFHLPRGLVRSEAKRRALIMLKGKEPNADFACFQYDSRTGTATAIRK